MLNKPLHAIRGRLWPPAERFVKHPIRRARVPGRQKDHLNTGMQLYSVNRGPAKTLSDYPFVATRPMRVVFPDVAAWA